MFDCLALILWQFIASRISSFKASSQYFRCLLTVKTWTYLKREKRQSNNWKPLLTTFFPYIYSRSQVTQLINRFNTLHVVIDSLFKVYECAVGAVGLHQFLASAFTHETFRCRCDWLRVNRGFVFHKLRALVYKFFHKQKILYQLLIKLHLIRFNSVSLNILANFFFLPTDRPYIGAPYRALNTFKYVLDPFQMWSLAWEWKRYSTRECNYIILISRRISCRV